MLAAVKYAKDDGYTDEQANVIGQFNELVEKAVELDMCTSVEAVTIGVYLRQIFSRHTGKMPVAGVLYSERRL